MTSFFVLLSLSYEWEMYGDITIGPDYRQPHFPTSILDNLCCTCLTGILSAVHSLGASSPVVVCIGSCVSRQLERPIRICWMTIVQCLLHKVAEYCIYWRKIV